MMHEYHSVILCDHSVTGKVEEITNENLLIFKKNSSLFLLQYNLSFERCFGRGRGPCDIINSTRSWCKYNAINNMTNNVISIIVNNIIFIINVVDNKLPDPSSHWWNVAEPAKRGHANCEAVQTMKIIIIMLVVEQIS